MTHERSGTSRRGLFGLLALAASWRPGTAVSASPSAETIGGVLARIRDLPDGGVVPVPRGNHVLAGVRFGGQRIRIVGDAANVSILQMETGGACIDLDSGGGGGQYQSGVRSVGFQSSNTLAKVAIRARNVSTLVIEDIGVASGNWRGSDTIGILTLGRELVTVRDAVLACARPIVFGPNPDHPTLCTDFFQVTGGLLQGEAAMHACLEFESGCVLSNTTIAGVAFVKGGDGIRWHDGAPARGHGASIHLKIADCRFEQGLDPDGWCIDLRSAANGLQELSVENCRIDPARNGVRLRNVLRAKFDTVTFNSTDKIALDIVLVPGGIIEFSNCTVTGGAFKIRNGRCVRRLRDTRARGFSETWVYDTGLIADRAVLADTAHCTAQVSVPAGERVTIADLSYSGRIAIGIRNGYSAEFQILGNNKLAVIQSESNTGNQWSDRIGTAGTSNVGYVEEVGAYVLENRTRGVAEYWYDLQGSAW